MSIGTAGEQGCLSSLPRELVLLQLCDCRVESSGSVKFPLWNFIVQPVFSTLTPECPIICGILQVTALVCWTASFHCSAVVPFTQPLGH